MARLRVEHRNDYWLDGDYYPIVIISSADKRLMAEVNDWFAMNMWGKVRPAYFRHGGDGSIGWFDPDPRDYSMFVLRWAGE